MGEVEVPALKNVSVEIKKGDFVAIMGASGSGKSTMMNCVGCLDLPTKGSVLLKGKEGLIIDKYKINQNGKIKTENNYLIKEDF